MLCTLLDGVFSNKHWKVTVLFVNDGSSSDAALPALSGCPRLDSVKVLNLKRNMGHQRAIALGLAYVQHDVPCDLIVVMDGDGEDKPQDVPTLLEVLQTSGAKVVFAERRKRLEGPLFRFAYFLYRTLHRVLTGRKVRFGNFSAMRFSALGRLTIMPELWTHYAATVRIARLSLTTIQIDRGPRLRGSTKMTFDSLALHGLAAMALYPTINVRVLIGSLIVACLVLFSAVVAVTIRLTTRVYVPGWTTLIVAFSLTLLCITTFMSLLFVFVGVSFRALPGVLPARDYQYFIDSCQAFRGAAREDSQAHRL